MGKTVTQETKIRILELRAEGLSYRKIAEALGIGKQTAVDVVNEYPEHMATLQAIEMEAFIEARQVDAKGRIEQLSKLYTRLLDELQHRDLADLPTDKLVTLLLKTSEALAKEVVTPIALSSGEQESERTKRELSSIF